jgi:hypothetical protein
VVGDIIVVTHSKAYLERKSIFFRSGLVDRAFVGLFAYLPLAVRFHAPAMVVVIYATGGASTFALQALWKICNDWLGYCNDRYPNEVRKLPPLFADEYETMFAGVTDINDQSVLENSPEGSGGGGKACQ